MQHVRELERAFEDLQWSFMKPSSTRCRLVSLEHFLSARRMAEAAHPGSGALEPYLLEWAGEIAQLAESLVPDGLDADCIDHVADLLDRSRRVSPLVGADVHLKSAVLRLREKARSHRRLVGRDSERVRAGAPSQGLYVPVVESPPGGFHDRLVPGIRVLRFELEDPGPGRDAISFEPASSDPSILGSPCVGNAIAASLRQVAKWQPAVQRGQVSGRFRYSELGVLHEGASDGLALAVTHASALARARDCSVYPCPIPHLAVTGDLDLDGNVVASEPFRLPARVEAAFHSVAGSLAVPVTQVDLARRHAALLHRRFPDRTLEIVGVASLEEFFDDARLVREEHPTVLSRALRSVWRRRHTVN